MFWLMHVLGQIQEIFNKQKTFTNERVLHQISPNLDEPELGNMVHLNRQLFCFGIWMCQQTEEV